MRNLKTGPTRARNWASHRTGFRASQMGAVILLIALASGVLQPVRAPARQQVVVPSLTDPNLAVRIAVDSLPAPIGIAFLPGDGMLVIEKNNGKVIHFRDGATSTVLDLAVNNAAERGLLGIALDPRFERNRFVYLYWTDIAPHPTDPFYPSLREGTDPPHLGADTSDPMAVPLLGNRVDRFVWTGNGMFFDRNLIKLRAFQNDGAPMPPNQGDGAQPAAANHNGGVIRFGPDGYLYIVIGDNGRRGWMQNLPYGPTPGPHGEPSPDDQFGGPEPDDAHLTGVILRVDRDGAAPPDNPFFSVGTFFAGEVGRNLQKVYAYGIRNSFGLAFDSVTGKLWMSENGDDTYDEIDQVEAGLNSGWVQVMGPLARVNDFRQIEMTFGTKTLQQLRWPPTNIAGTPLMALARLTSLPEPNFHDPELSWRYAVAPAAIGFVLDGALGPGYAGDLFVGMGVAAPMGGPLFRLQLSQDRRHLAFADPRLQDRVADNNKKSDLTESESLLFGSGFGTVTDIQTGPNGSLYIVSIDHGVIYEIYRNR